MAPTPAPPVPPSPMTDQWLSPEQRIAAALEDLARSPLQGGPERANLDQLLAEAYGTGASHWFILATAAVVIVGLWVIGWLAVETRKAVERHRAVVTKEQESEVRLRRLETTELNAVTRARREDRISGASIDTPVDLDAATEEVK